MENNKKIFLLMGSLLVFVLSLFLLAPKPNKLQNIKQGNDISQNKEKENQTQNNLINEKTNIDTKKNENTKKIKRITEKYLKILKNDKFHTYNIYMDLTKLDKSNKYNKFLLILKNNKKFSGNKIFIEDGAFNCKIYSKNTENLKILCNIKRNVNYGKYLLGKELLLITTLK